MEPTLECHVCKNQLKRKEIRFGRSLTLEVFQFIRNDLPDFESESPTCSRCLSKKSNQALKKYLELQKIKILSHLDPIFDQNQNQSYTL